MINTIISNNCTGGAVCHELGMEFKSPTVNLQILPEDYIPFCAHLKEFMNEQIFETFAFDLPEVKALNKMFGGIPNFPIGRFRCGGLICFQHYATFGEAKAKWDERKAKIDYDHIGYIFHARGEEYRAEAEEFLALDLPNKLCITQNFEVPGSVRMDGEGFDSVNGKLRIVQAYDYRRWVSE